MTVYKFPVAIGDTVVAYVEEDHVKTKIPYKVCGVAQIGEKQYVFDECGERHEIGSETCMVGVER